VTRVISFSLLVESYFDPCLCELHVFGANTIKLAVSSLAQAMGLEFVALYMEGFVSFNA